MYYCKLYLHEDNSVNYFFWIFVLVNFMLLYIYINMDVSSQLQLYQYIQTNKPDKCEHEVVIMFADKNTIILI